MKAVGDKARAAKDSLDMKKRSSEASKQKYEAAKEKADAAKKLQETKDLEYIRGRSDASDRILASKDRANQAAGSVDQRKTELSQAQDLVKKLIEKIEKGGRT